METHLKIGKSILEKYSVFADKNTLDDESEYFPALKIIIDSVIESYNGSAQGRNYIEKKLVEHVKQLYVCTWLKYAKEDQKEPDIEEETNDAIERFNELFFIKRRRSKKK
ncbi:MAG: hypothetical protein U9Q23_05695 [Candidatus Bipolaricaulota bacterium]|nr:hypothetical protein [Candidatus Bipolaricaulota bacterium]